MDKQLKDKALDIKGKPYVPVAERVVFFNKEHQNGKIETQLVSEPSSEQVVVKAIVTPDIEKPMRYFTGYAQEVVGKGFINSTSALENAETSAIGRALAMMGIGVIESIASSDEIQKAQNRQIEPQKTNARVMAEQAYNATRKAQTGIKDSGSEKLTLNPQPGKSYKITFLQNKPFWGDEKKNSHGYNCLVAIKGDGGESNSEATVFVDNDLNSQLLDYLSKHSGDPIRLTVNGDKKNPEYHILPAGIADAEEIKIEDIEFGPSAMK